jgi:hypothetical protein
VHWIRRYVLFHNKRHPREMKDRVTLLPDSLIAPLQQHLQRVRQLHLHQSDLSQGCGFVELPLALERKYPNAGRE